ncbi:MAG: flippase-like domain-containing protein [Propionibacteriaceae bacterium]|jgi:uncharacterized protein (TIRG00374 family)|nr:flippase-like domain-containing protein [Propionibacteriaceae bacterium]
MSVFTPNPSDPVGSSPGDGHRAVMARAGVIGEAADGSTARAKAIGDERSAVAPALGTGESAAGVRIDSTGGRAPVGIRDEPRTTVRNPSDLIGVIGCGLGVILVCLMVVYAHNTTEGMAADVRAFAVLLQRILFVPVAVLDMAVIVFPPVAVGVELLTRRHPMTALHGLIGGIGGIILGVIILVLIRELGPESLVAGLSIRQGGVNTVTIPIYVCAITAGLTTVATPARRRSIVWSWNLMWIAVVVAVVTTTASLPGMVIALFAGRLMGYVARYTFGVASQRAYGATLIEGIERAGFTPLTINRVALGEVDPVDPDESPRHEDTSRIRPKASLATASLGVGPAVPVAAGTQAPQFFSDHRLYLMRSATDKLYNVIVLDGDRQVMGVLNRVWRYLRSRAIEGRTSLSLRQTAERTALISSAVRSAGVATPAVLAIAEADDSMIIVREASSGSVSFATMDPGQVTDAMLDAMWTQICRAHRCGIAHRALTAQCFWFDGPGLDDVALLGWETGDVASSDLARSIDLTQMIALIAAKVGCERATASAARAMSPAELTQLGPLLQVPAIPKQTREALGDAKAVLAQLRTMLAVRDTAEAPPVGQIARIGARTIIMAVLVAAAIIIVLTSFNLREVAQAVQHSDWRWAIAALAIGLVAPCGSALALLAFSPVKLPFWKAYLAQIAAGFVALAAPAGIGPAAINARLMTRNKVPTPVAAATAALAQAANVVTVVLALVVLTVATGSSQLTSFQLTPGIMVAISIAVALVGTVMVIPKTRVWVLGRVMPLFRQTWPRLVELFSSPYRLGLGILGNIIFLMCNITAFLWSVYAFGRTTSLLGVALVYLIGTSAGSVIPTPGGMGTIEVTESATLVSLGLNAGVAASIVLLFRLVTYWLRVPIGWVAYRWLTRHGQL